MKDLKNPFAWGVASMLIGILLVLISRGEGGLTVAGICMAFGGFVFVLGFVLGQKSARQ